MNWNSELISFRIDWFYLLAVQGTLKGRLQHHIMKTSILWCSAFNTVQLSHLYITTGKIIALTMHTFVGKVMSLLFNSLSRFVIAFLPRSMVLHTQLSPTLCDTMHCSPPDSSVLGFPRQEYWSGYPFLSPWDQTIVSCIICGFFTTKPLGLLG